MPDGRRQAIQAAEARGDWAEVQRLLREAESEARVRYTLAKARRDRSNIFRKDSLARACASKTIEAEEEAQT